LVDAYLEDLEEDGDINSKLELNEMGSKDGNCVTIVPIGGL
jgi:hypothetical protein